MSKKIKTAIVCEQYGTDYPPLGGNVVDAIALQPGLCWLSISLGVNQKSQLIQPSPHAQVRHNT